MNLDTLKSQLADRGHDAIHSVEASLHDGRDALLDTTHAVGKDVSKAAMKAASVIGYANIVSAFGKAATALVSAGGFLATVTPERTMTWALHSVGLQRRPSLFSRVATGTGLVIAGAAVGAGVAVLFSPKSGPQTRNIIAKGIDTFRKDAEHTLEDIEHKALDVVHDGEHKVQDVVHDVEGRARSLMGDVAIPTESTTSPVGGATSGGKRHTGISHRAPKL